jgi:O-antigen/teichoic acid export membrane protein
MNLARRSIISISWNFAANAAVVILLAVRMILLTRWLSPEIFGVYAYAYAIVVLTAIIPNFGMGQAFIHRTAETENEDEAAAVHFSLRLTFTTIWAVILLAGTLLLTNGDLQTTLLIIVPVSFGIQMTQTPSLILRRRVSHKRLAIADFVEVVLASLVALTLAWRGAGLWALLATDIVSVIVKGGILFLWRPFWKPRLQWNRELVRYYLHFGSRAFVADALVNTLDKLDDLWTGIFLGQAALGIYSRAFTFATYPRKLLAAPINAVAGGMYAELKENRLSLSQAFFRTNAFLVRAGFLLAGSLALIAPELILLLGDQWQDMLIPFRLMLLFVLLDPIRLTIGLLFIAVGQPHRLVLARSFQLIALIVGLLLLGNMWGINGVALAVDMMLLLGISIMLRQARLFVDFSIWRLFSVPLLAMGTAFAMTLLVMNVITLDYFVLTAMLKLILFSATYLAVWLSLERGETMRMLHMFRKVRD